jgi:integrase
MPKKKTKANGEGTVYKRPDGRWCGQVSYGKDSISGNVKRQTFYGSTKAEVLAKMDEAKHNLSMGIFVEPSKIKFCNFFTFWLDEFKQNAVKESTYSLYKSIGRLYIIPDIGDIPLQEINTELIQQKINEYHRQGKSASIIKTIKILIYSSLKQAVKNGRLNRNPAENIALPKQNKKEMSILTLNEQQQFIKALEGDRLRALYLIAIGTGIREGELLALRWKNVNLESGTINIIETLLRIKDYSADAKKKTKLVVQEPKTKASNRTVPIPDSVLVEIKNHRKLQLQERLKAGEAYADNDLVFCNEVGQPIEPSYLRVMYYRILEKAKIKHKNFHTLRHTFASRMLESNVQGKVVQELLGHGSISMTLDIYSHLLPETKKNSIQQIDHLLKQTN